MSTYTVLEKFDKAWYEVAHSNGTLKLVVRSYGRVWNGMDRDYAYSRKCISNYTYPDKLEIMVVPVEQEVESIEPKRKQFTARRKDHVWRELLVLLDTQKPMSLFTDPVIKIQAELDLVKARIAFETLTMCQEDSTKQANCPPSEK